MDNPFIQKVFVFAALVIAIAFLVKIYILPKKPKNKKNCGNESCGC